ncbi:hypothetical protein [Rheinheimera sp.]|uniref:hypothetical protein n=1 Tax=Rheinheimera sp. TaxID=1869214 RepID=UPI00307DD84E
MKGILLIFLILLTGCSLLPEKPTANHVEHFSGIRNGRLLYLGELSEQANQALFDAYAAADVKPKQLLISSGGGDIAVGLVLGQWVRQHQLDVAVDKICASSCANYVFPAGRNKYLKKDSILLWHGSAWQKHWDYEAKHKDSVERYLRDTRLQESDFYDRLSVDNALTVYGQDKFSLWDHFVSMFGQGYIGYDYSIADLNRFGVTNIVLKDGEWDWRKHRPDKAHLVKRVKVGNDFIFTLRRFGNT